jgi:aminoglycoside phosphotransferase (APT) family kinase protein
MQMHEGQIQIDASLVEALLADQHPELAGRPVSLVRSTGTVNALFRIGDDLCARFPILGQWADNLTRELQWLPYLASRLSLRVPEPVIEGEPTERYPLPWAIYRWIEGVPYADELVDDEPRAAGDLAQFVGELRAAPLHADAPKGGRPPLKIVDGFTRPAIEASGGVIDVDLALDAWDRSLEAPVWDGEPNWIHTDLLRSNLLVDDGRLRAVIDFGGVGVGDPAIDVIPAWSVFGPAGRAVFRSSLDVDDGTWARARGVALHQAALIIPYYGETNPGFVALAARTIAEILADIAT